MTIRRDMITAAAGAKHLLNDSAEDVLRFTAAQMNSDGGFKGRSSQSDLYYTVFAIESLLALGAGLPTRRIVRFLDSFGDGEGLDFVHLACLARCRANLDMNTDDQFNKNLASRIELFRSEDGGYANSTRSKRGTAYGCFLGLGANQDLNLELPDPQGLMNCIDSLKTQDGAYSNEATIKNGSTPGTAAALTSLHYLGRDPEADASQWLLARSRATGGFLATAMAPIPDLLSTATATHALAVCGVDIESIKQPTLEFIDSLWSTEGAFSGNWMDDTLDCEYTYYALLALGHLAGD